MLVWRVKRMGSGLTKTPYKDFTLKQKMAQWEGEFMGASVPLDNVMDKNLGLEQKLAYSDKDNSKLQSDVDATLNTSDLDCLNDDDLKLKQRIVNLEDYNAKLKKDVHNALSQTKVGTVIAYQLQRKNVKLKQKVVQQRDKLGNLQNILINALSVLKKSFGEVEKLLDRNEKLKQQIVELERQLKGAQGQVKITSKIVPNLGTALREIKPAVERYSSVRVRPNIVEGKGVGGHKDTSYSNNILINAEAQTDLRKAFANIKSEVEVRGKGVGGKSDTIKGETEEVATNYNAEINQLQVVIEEKKRESANMIISLKELFDRDMLMNLLQKNEHILRLQKVHMDMLAKLKDKYDEGIKLNKTKEQQKTIIDKQSKVKSMHVDQSRNIIENKNEVQEAEGVDFQERRKKDLEKIEVISTLDKLNQCTVSMLLLKDNDINIKRKLGMLEVDNAKLKSRLNMALIDAKKCLTGVDQLREERVKLRQRLLQLETENIKLKSDLNNLLNEVKESEADLSKFTDDGGKWKQKIAHLEDENLQLKENLIVSRDELQNASASFSQLQEVNGKRKTGESALRTFENEKLKTDLERALEETKKLMLVIAQLKDDKSKLETQVAQLEADNSKLNNDLDDSVCAAKISLTDIQQLKDDDNKLRQKIVDLAIENANLKKTHDATTRNAKRAADQKLKVIKNLEDKNSNLKKEVDWAKQNLKNCDDTIKLLKGEIDTMQQQLLDLQNNSATLKKTPNKAMGDAPVYVAKLQSCI